MGIVLPFTWVSSMEDVQYNMEQIAADGVGLSQITTGTNRTELLSALGIARGVATLTFTASTNSGNITVNHGLAGTPTVVVGTADGAVAFGEIPIVNTFSLTSTTFGMNGQTTSSWSGSVGVSWIAIL